MGIGAPPHTGGLIQFVNTYGKEAFIERCKTLEADYGERFECPQIVHEMLEKEEMFV